ncbi:hypothetical protein MC885_014314 [Smutsia gigantea]|nr:hypothetical protein MC885_014314 [Smutsia gigantea]
MPIELWRSILWLPQGLGELYMPSWFSNIGWKNGLRGWVDKQS